VTDASTDNQRENPKRNKASTPTVARRAHFTGAAPVTKILAHLTPAVFLLFSLPAPAATPAPAGYLDASKMPGAPFDSQDATAALKSAIQSRAAKVWVPNMGVPWLIDTIWLTSNQEILLENGVVIESRPGKAFHVDGQLFKIASQKNVTLKGYGATLKMRRDLFASGKPYKRSEHRHAIVVYASRNVKLLGLTIKDAGGDGIMVGGMTHTSYNKGVLIKDVLITNAYRNAISIISAEDLTIDNAVLINTNGTSPQVGLDFEPDHEKQRIVNFAVRNCIIMNNKRLGICFPVSGLLTASDRERGLPIRGVIENCTIYNNGFHAWGGGVDKKWGDGLFMKWHLDDVTVKNNLFVHNAGAGFLVDGYAIDHLHKASFCAFWGNKHGTLAGQAGPGKGIVTDARPVFVSTDPANPNFMHLSPKTSTRITRGSSTGSFIGARPVASRTSK
tara:strand:+ start:958 stop:2295 length:1338 start_codon:yes stop_codon:yes gene_type:complete